MFIKIFHKNKIYVINKEKILFILEKLEQTKIKENNIKKLMKKYRLIRKESLILLSEL